MKNTLIKLPFYKGKSVMIIESSIGVTYGEANPFIQFKFAPRDDHKSQGKWDDNNSFWLTSFVELYGFVNGMNLVATGKLQKHDMKNPKKGTAVQITSSQNTQSNVEYINFGFYRGDVKIMVSLEKNTEYVALFAYFKNMIDNFNTICAISLLRNDVYYKFFVEGKGKDGGKAYDGAGQKTGSKYDGHAGDPSSTGGYNDDGMMKSFESEVGAMGGGFSNGIDDVPF